jgi:hypothetical protein
VKSGPAGLALGAIAVVAIAIALAVAGRGGDEEPTPAATEATADAPEPESTGEPIPPETARDLAGRLARAWDAGPRSPSRSPGAVGGEGIEPEREAAEAEPSPHRDVPAAPTTPQIPPLTTEQQLEYASQLHDLIILRRDDLRRQREEAEQRGDRAAIARIDHELESLDRGETHAREHVGDLAARRRAESAAE